MEFLTEEHKKKISETKKGVSFSDEHKRKISEALKRRFLSEYIRDKIRKGRLGKKHSEETKRKISISLTGKKHTNESRFKMSVIKKEMIKQGLLLPFFQKGMKHSEETKLKMRGMRGMRIPRIKRICKNCNMDFFILISQCKKSNAGLFHNRRCKAIFYKKLQKNKDTMIEVAIENELKKRNIFYQKQISIEGVALVDFLLPNKIIIQCDGIYWHNLEEHKKRDIWQDKILKSKGYRIFRFLEPEINKSPTECINKINFN